MLLLKSITLLVASTFWDSKGTSLRDLAVNGNDRKHSLRSKANAWNVKSAVKDHHAAQTAGSLNALVGDSVRSNLKAEILSQLRDEIRDIVKQEVAQSAGEGTCYLHFAKPFGSLKRGGDYKDVELGGKKLQSRKSCSARSTINNHWEKSVQGSYWFPNESTVASIEKHAFDRINKKFNGKKFDNVVIVTSKIYVSKKPLSYSPTRSTYTTQQRFEGVLETIKSVRKYIGGNQLVVLVDNSEFTYAYKQQLEAAVDVFINNHDDPRLNFYTSVHPQKGAGEVLQVSSAMAYLKRANIRFDHLFKITGRYILNKSFNKKQYYSEDVSMFKQRLDVKDRDYFYTSFFKICQADQTKFEKALKSVFEAYMRDEYKQFNGWQDEEVLLPMLMGKGGDGNKSAFKKLTHLGLTQRVSVGGTGTVADV